MLKNKEGTQVHAEGHPKMTFHQLPLLLLLLQTAEVTPTWRIIWDLPLSSSITVRPHSAALISVFLLSLRNCRKSSSFWP